jgi:hypothetical protein
VAIKLSGQFDVTKTPEEVYDFLTDPNKFAPLLPDFQGVTVHDPRTLQCESECGHFVHQGDRRRENALVGIQSPEACAIQGARKFGGRKHEYGRRVRPITNRLLERG